MGNALLLFMNLKNCLTKSTVEDSEDSDDTDGVTANSTVKCVITCCASSASDIAKELPYGSSGTGNGQGS